VGKKKRFRRKINKLKSSGRSLVDFTIQNELLMMEISTPKNDILTFLKELNGAETIR
jgi:hypothetical protein